MRDGFGGGVRKRTYWKKTSGVPDGLVQQRIVQFSTTSVSKLLCCLCWMEDPPPLESEQGVFGTLGLLCNDNDADVLGPMVHLVTLAVVFGDRLDQNES